MWRDYLRTDGGVGITFPTGLWTLIMNMFSPPTDNLGDMTGASALRFLKRFPLPDVGVKVTLIRHFPRYFPLQLFTPERLPRTFNDTRKHHMK